MKRLTVLFRIMSTILFATWFTLQPSNVRSQTLQEDFFKNADAFFKRHVDETGNVDYAGIKSDPAVLEALYKQIGSFSLNGKSINYQKAFYTNAYNILVIKQVVDRFPIVGPLTVDGFFDKIKHKVTNEQLTLNQVEKDKNLYVNKDERLHFALVCAAKSCPPLANYAFFPEKVDDQLEERTRLALNNEGFLRVKKKSVEISQIFNWYKDDFINNDVKDLVAYINKYRKNQIPSDLKIVYYEYNWSLNKK